LGFGIFGKDLLEAFCIVRLDLFISGFSEGAVSFFTFAFAADIALLF
jgi:hypothetical protein